MAAIYLYSPSYIICKRVLFPRHRHMPYNFPKLSCYQTWWKSCPILCSFCFSTNYKSNQDEAIRPRHIRTIRTLCLLVLQSKTLSVKRYKYFAAIHIYHYHITAAVTLWRLEIDLTVVLFLQRRKNVYLQRLLLYQIFICNLLCNIFDLKDTYLYF